MIFLLDRITPDVLINPASMEKRQIFHALRKQLEFVGTTVGYAPGIPMTNKVSTALYAGYPELLEHANDMLSNYKTYGTIYKVVTPNDGSPAPLSLTPGSLTHQPWLMDADRRKDQIESEKEE